MDVTLIDWTRMGRVYCLAGAIVQAGQLRVVCPLPARARGAGVPNQGWSPYLLDGHSRWEVFEMVRPAPGLGQPPHLEDVWWEICDRAGSSPRPSSARPFSTPPWRRPASRRSASN